MNQDYLSELTEEIKKQRALIEFLLCKSSEVKKTVNLQDIADLEGVSVSQLREGGKERYLVPRFGESAYPTGRSRWSIEEYLEWSKTDPQERLRCYLTHLKNASKRA